MRTAGLRGGVVVLAVALAVPAHAQSPAATIVHSDVREVHACEARPGGVLAGTSGGLVSLDAGAARVWTAVDGLPGTRIHALVADGDRTWVGAEAGAAEVTVTRAGLTIHRAIAARPVRDLVRHGDRLYLATWGDGVRIADSRGRTSAVAIAGDDPARLRVSALASVDGQLWAGTAAGVYRLDGAAFAPVALASPEPEVTSLLGDGATLWIATVSGLHRWDGAARALGGGDLRRVARLDGAIVVAGLGGGLQRVDRGRLVPLAGAPRDLVMAQAVAGTDTAACAGGLDGLWTRTAATWIRAALPVGLPSNDVSALAVERRAGGDRLWVGTFDRGLAVVENGTWRTVLHPELDARINAIAIERDRVWVGTAAGLTAIDEGGARVSRVRRSDGLPSRHVLSLAVLRDGRLLVGTTQGAAIVGDGRPLPLGAKQGLDVGNVWAVAEDADGFLWLGTTTGVYRGRPDDGAWVRRSVATGDLRDDWVMALAPRGRSMWVGTYKGGVTRFDWDAAGALTAAPRARGWINPGGLAWVGGSLLAATMDGLRVIEGDRVSLPSSPGRDTTAIAADADRLWIATRRGLIERRAAPALRAVDATAVVP